MLLLCGFFGVSSRCVLKVTVLGLVTASRTAGKNVGILLGPLNSTIPNLNDAGYERRMSGLVKSLNTSNLHGRTWRRVLC